MYKRENVRKRIRVAASITALLLVFLSIAFAALFQTLNISFGSVTQTAMSWGVGFQGTTSIPISTGTSNTGLSCGVASVTSSTVTIAQSTLSKPGDKCTYSLTIQNTGDVPAELSSISATQPTGVSCSVEGATMECGNITYNLVTDAGVELTTDTIINNADILDVKLEIIYTGEELNGNGTTHNGAKFTLTYKQSDITAGQIDPNKIICKRATTLHQSLCLYAERGLGSQGCGENYSKGEKITFGTLGTDGVLSPGDAFDCDVNGDGTYDSDTERFYYVSGINGDDTSPYAVMFYYSNVSDGEADSEKCYAYYNSGSGTGASDPNNLGPLTAYLQLPTTEQWSNVRLSNGGRRQLYAEDGTTKTSAGDLPIFEYKDRAARLIDYREINRYCPLSMVYNSISRGDLDSCEYLLENTSYELVGYYGGPSYSGVYHLENPVSVASSYNYTWFINGYPRAAVSQSTSNCNGVRPVIEVLKTQIEY